jgi:hypothetical protein
MKRIFLIVVMAFLLSACGTMNNAPGTQTSSDAADFKRTFRDFTACDARFFQALKQNTAAWEFVAPLEDLGNYSRIKVRDGDHVDFTVPPKVAGLELLSFFDKMSDLDRLGLYYYWGFTVSGKMEDVVKKFKPLVFNRARLRRDGAEYVRTEVKVPLAGTRWLPLKTSSNTPVGEVNVERVFIIEQDEDNENITRVSCSLQGGVNADILREIRPDIAPKDYPVSLSATLFDDVQTPGNVNRIVRDSQWKPGFKKLSYTFIPKSSGSARTKKPKTITINMEALDNLVQVREIYSPFFHVQRLMLAGPGQIQLKGRINNTGRVFLTTDIKTSFPVMLKKDEKLSVVTKTKEQPPMRAGGDEEMQFSRLCTIIEAFDAKEVFPMLTGRAYRMSCTFNDKEVGDIGYIEDLGISIELDVTSFTQFSVE